jgi:hypothetical protein
MQQRHDAHNDIQQSRSHREHAKLKLQARKKTSALSFNQTDTIHCRSLPRRSRFRSRRSGARAATDCARSRRRSCVACQRRHLHRCASSSDVLHDGRAAASGVHMRRTSAANQSGTHRSARHSGRSPATTAFAMSHGNAISANGSTSHAGARARRWPRSGARCRSNSSGAMLIGVPSRPDLSFDAICMMPALLVGHWRRAPSLSRSA